MLEPLQNVTKAPDTFLQIIPRSLSPRLATRPQRYMYHLTPQSLGYKQTNLFWVWLSQCLTLHLQLEFKINFTAKLFFCRSLCKDFFKAPLFGYIKSSKLHNPIWDLPCLSVSPSTAFLKLFKRPSLSPPKLVTSV